MKLFEVLVVLNLCALASVHGQLNASRLELTQRFGQPTREKGNQAFGSSESVFLNEGWVIRASMLDDRCQVISYLKPQFPSPTPEQIESLMERNSGGGAAWSNQGVRSRAVTTAEKPFSQVHYPRSDGGAFLVKAINGVVFKSARWHQLEEGARERSAETPLLSQIKPSAPKKMVKTWLGHSSQYASAQLQKLITGEGLKLGGVLPLMGGLALIGIGLVFRVWMRSPSVKGWVGEKLTYHLFLKRLDPAVYQVFNNVYLPMPYGPGTTQIDHVVLSPHGVYVIETKNINGWIFGKEQDSQWTQQLYRKKFFFQNPLRQNCLHVEALRTFLDLPREAFQSIVFLIGKGELKTDLPPHVMTSGLRYYIERHRLVTLEEEQLRCAGADLAAWEKESRNPAVRRNHIRDLRLRHGEAERRAA